MAIKKMTHIGIVVDELQRAVDKFKGFGLECKEVVEIKELGVKIGFFPIGDSQLELICHVDPEKSRESIVWKQKGAINHLCFEVDDLEKSLQDFEKSGAKVLKGYPRAGAHGKVAFLDPETTEGVLIELCQY